MCGFFFYQSLLFFLHFFIAVIKAAVAVIAENIENKSVYMPPIKKPTHRKIAAIVINNTVDNILKTSYNIVRVSAPRLPRGFSLPLTFFACRLLAWAVFLFAFKV